MYVASQKGQLDTIRALCELKADINQAANDRATILPLQGQLDTVRALYELKADINQAENNGATPVYAASQEGQLEFKEHLLM